MEEQLNNIIELVQDLKAKFLYEKKKNRPITERVKTFEDACEVLGKQYIFSCAGESGKREVVLNKLEIITKALNEGWYPNWDDADEKKWIPCFIMSASGFRFACSDFAYSVADAGCGSRLRFKSEALANYAGEQFAELYKEIML